MATKEKNLQVQDVEKEEVAQINGTERTRASTAYVPKADIYELDEEIVVVADMPGVAEDAIDITLEKDILTINGYVEPDESDKYSLIYAEYEAGDYHRRFTLSNQIDQDNIQATLKDGVLRVHLPKSASAKARKISVKTT
ncbi:MAG: Hsp20/alpha crystallin family protein [Anaerolineae bacterium]|nr:Hsp20/alpha crystallin family protein [Anaerolineae bacterium]